MNFIDKDSENYVYYYVGKNIKKYRKQKGMTQDQLANATNYCKQFISNMENETHQTFSVGTVWQIARALDVELYKLFIEDEEYMSKFKDK